MARLARLYFGCDYRVVENTIIHFETINGMAYLAIHVHCRMTRYYACGVSAIVAGIAAFSDNVGTGVVDKSRLKRFGVMTIPAIGFGYDMTVFLVLLALGDHAVVAGAARLINIGVVVCAVQVLI